jgi:hypothetical protein
MALGTTDRTSIARLRLLGRVAVVMGIAGAAAAAASLFFAAPANPKVQIQLPELDPIRPATSGSPDAIKADTEALASRLLLVSNTPKPKEQPKVDGAAPPPVQVFNLKDHVRFLGLVSEPKRMIALLAVDAKQRMVAEKDVFKVANGASQVSVTVKSISDSAIVLQDDKGEHTIDIALKTGSALTKGKAAPNSSATSANLPPGVVPMTPEQALAKIATIRQAQRDKQMMLRKERLEEFARENSMSFEEADKALREKMPELYEDDEKDGK